MQKKISFIRNREKDAALRQKLQRIHAHDIAIPPADVKLEIGGKMKDGTIYAGLSPDTGVAMYAAPADAPVCMSFNAAAGYVRTFKVGDKKDFRIPSRAELKVLFEHRNQGALKGSFNLTGLEPAGWYMSSSYDEFCDEEPFSISTQRMSDGVCGHEWKTWEMSLRCVRG